MVNFTAAISTEEAQDKNRVYYENALLDGTEEIPRRLQGNVLLSA